MRNIVLSLILSLILATGLVIYRPAILIGTHNNKILADVSYSLADRYNDPYVNNVFSDNILLTIAYMGGKVVLQPGKTFAFHDAIMQKYQGKVSATTNAHFNLNEGFKSDGWLIGDGVCHLASFMYVASKEAGLFSEAPTAHDFATIADVPKKYGVSIFYSPNDPDNSTQQNLYITKNRVKPIAFIFTKKDTLLNIKVEELN
jgi:hypothetical protein